MRKNKGLKRFILILGVLLFLISLIALYCEYDQYNKQIIVQVNRMNEENRLLNEQIVILEQQLYDLSERVNLIDQDLGLIKNDMKNIALKQPATIENTDANMNAYKNEKIISQSNLRDIEGIMEKIKIEAIKAGLTVPAAKYAFDRVIQKLMLKF
jgi:hypothetical protein